MNTGSRKGLNHQLNGEKVYKNDLLKNKNSLITVNESDSINKTSSQNILATDSNKTEEIVHEKPMIIQSDDYIPSSKVTKHKKTKKKSKELSVFLFGLQFFIIAVNIGVISINFSSTINVTNTVIGLSVIMFIASLPALMILNNKNLFMFSKRRTLIILSKFFP